MQQLDFHDLDSFLLSQKGKIIHQVWFDTITTKRKSKQLYKKLKIFRDSWKIKNPSWSHIEWNKNMCMDLINNIYPEYSEMFQSYSYEIQRCDAVRYFILHRYGGLYADMDYFCNRPWDDVLQEYTKEVYFVQTPNRNGKYVSNSLMFSRPNHPFWKYLFLELDKNKSYPIYYPRHVIVMFTTGPGIVNRVYERRKIQYRLGYYPSEFFHPTGIQDDVLSLKSNDSIFAMHLGKGSWEKRDSKIFLFFFREWRLVLCLILIFLFPFGLEALSWLFLKK